MGEWSSYQVRDFVLFSKDVYLGLLETYDQETWPARILAVIALIAVAMLLWRPNPVRSRMASGLLALNWLWIGGVFHLKYFVTINWAARYFGWLFLAEGALLIGIGLIGARLSVENTRGLRSYLGLGLVALAAGLVALMGWGPDATALATAGALLLARDRVRWLLLVPPLLWGLVASAMYYGLK